MKINLKKFKKVKSTNDIAINLIKKNISAPTLITSDKQTKGRGNRKNGFKKGNLFISIFLNLI